MDIYTVRDNLKNTIAGKEFLLLEFGKDDNIVAKTTVHYININLAELRVILADVEKCCENATNASWESNPERMGR